MASSTNYQWSEPDDTSLVKDGALAIRTLGNAIDTSLWNSGYGQAGKNKLINADFFVNQRNFTSSVYTAGNGNYDFDRWTSSTGGDSTSTVTPQTFTLGAAPVAGYEGKTFYRCVTSGGTNSTTRADVAQFIEDVRTFANQTIQVSFWAKAGSGTPSIGLEVTQSFGSGGSPSANVNTAGGAIPITTSWARYSATVAVPSISGKTLGTTNNNYLAIRLWLSAGSSNATRASSIGIQNNTFDIWGVQAEYGSKASPFQTASGGSIQNELAMCQRYYQQGNYGWAGVGVNTTTAGFFGNFPTMRTSPSVGATAAIKITDAATADYTQSSSSIGINSSTRVTNSSIFVTCANFTLLTSLRSYFTMPNEGGQIQLSAEL